MHHQSPSPQGGPITGPLRCVPATPMPSRRVCRLEHKDSGLGPFEHRLARNRQSDMVVKLPFHREPEEYPEFHEWLRHKELTKAFKLGQVSPVRFAWPDETTMRWFLARVPARRYGHWVVQVYEVHDYILLPDGQVAFDRRSAVKHTTTPLPQNKHSMKFCPWMAHFAPRLWTLPAA